MDICKRQFITTCINSTSTGFRLYAGGLVQWPDTIVNISVMLSDGDGNPSQHLLYSLH